LNDAMMGSNPLTTGNVTAVTTGPQPIWLIHKFASCKSEPV
jgi:hypothetical protein